MHNNYKSRFCDFIKQIELLKLDGFILTREDIYQGEEVRINDERLNWLSGFSGSAGKLIIINKKAAMFSDSRYTLQMKKELSSKIYESFDNYNISMGEWLKSIGLKKNREYKIGFCTWNYTKKGLETLKKDIDDTRINFVGINFNPVDKIWIDRPVFVQNPFWVLEQKYSGVLKKDKIKLVIKNLNKNDCELKFISSPSNVNWLLNIRGSDLMFSPVHLCFAIIDNKSKTTLLYDEKHIKNKSFTSITIKELNTWIKKHSQKKILCDPTSIPIGILEIFNKNKLKVVYELDNITALKAIKNNVEIKGFKKAHILDSIALTKFWHWFENKNQSPLSESQISKKIRSFRKLNKNYICDSFETIVGFGPNGAIVHYRPVIGKDLIIEGNNLLLVDTGAHYNCGTTDITRTFSIGVPSSEMIEISTMILASHINLAISIFPKKTTGKQLDAISRHNLWNNKIDYGHGTGHGVGHILNVHENPVSISKNSDNHIDEGNIISNEPGHYKTNNFGIRHENLFEVKKVNKDWLRFETLTLFPFDLNLIKKSILSKKQINWLNSYHEKVYKTLSPHLSKQLQLFLKKKCQKIKLLY